MFVLITRRRGSANARLVEDYDEAVNAAREHVGEHNPVDGCSTRVLEDTRRRTHGLEFSCSRSTSFGHRSATVRAIGTDFETSIL